jgi:DNA-binding FadR family transcriptional regulator
VESARPDVLVWMFEAEPERSLLNSLFELRNVVESAAASLAARRRSATHLRSMRAALKVMARDTLATESGRRADLEFHATLLQATRNPFMISLTSGVSAAISATTVFKQRRGPLRRDPMPDHYRVLEAIAAREPQKAERAMSELIMLALRDTPESPRGRRRATG